MNNTPENQKRLHDELQLADSVWQGLAEILQKLEPYSEGSRDGAKPLRVTGLVGPNEQVQKSPESSLHP